MAAKPKGKTKAWRREPCPRNDAGRKIKGANRRAKNAGISVDQLLAKLGVRA